MGESRGERERGKSGAGDGENEARETVAKERG